MSPEPSNLRFLAIASASALAGFGLVWGALCLRGPAEPAADTDTASVESVTFAPAEPDALPPLPDAADIEATPSGAVAADPLVVSADLEAPAPDALAPLEPAPAGSVKMNPACRFQ